MECVLIKSLIDSDINFVNYTNDRKILTIIVYRVGMSEFFNYREKIYLIFLIYNWYIRIFLNV